MITLTTLLQGFVAVAQTAFTSAARRGSIDSPLRLLPAVIAILFLPNASAEERQLTHAPHDHVLTNVNCWSGDGRWIAFDSRSADGTSFDGNRIEIVNTETCDVRALYQSQSGAGCGAVSFDPSSDRVAFILGPENPDVNWNYAATRRRGALVELVTPGVIQPLDAMNYAPPFTPGALRGGSHVHVFSPDGRWISFTYDDDVLACLDATKPDATHDRNQRNVAVAVPVPCKPPLTVARTHPRNNDGGWFSAVVTRTVNQPHPGSDEISRAFEEGWIGTSGYSRADGSRQKRALAFQGIVTAANGRQHAEVFIVDLPDDLTRPGGTPLEGTATTRLAPPAGTTQRRLTFTDTHKFPGIVTSPRHWLRTSPDGSQIAFLMRDDAGVVQLHTISPHDSAPRQITHCEKIGVASAFTWDPCGRKIAAIVDGSVCMIDVLTGAIVRLTPRREGDAVPLSLACVFSPDGARIAYTRRVSFSDNKYSQIFITDADAATAQ